MAGSGEAGFVDSQWTCVLRFCIPRRGVFFSLRRDSQLAPWGRGEAVGEVLISGGAGFIGCNTAQRFLELGHRVVVLDNLSRKGAKLNLAWLQEQGSIDFVQVDIRDAAAVREAIGQHPRLDAIVHLASQVAVTTSVQDPREDFEVNALGTFNLLEAARLSKGDPVFLFASTNKVYGGLEGVTVVERDNRHTFRDLPGGIGEDHQLDFHSPYGCSKGAADQYVRDYGRIYGLRTVVLRQSCIYGHRQFGVEDQGWVAWFTIAAVLGKPIVIYGDGKQVRDLLFIDDMVEGYRVALDQIDQASGKIYNFGGGPQNVLSLLELIAILEDLAGRKIPYSFEDWRPGDQPVFICNIDKASRELNWKPRVSPKKGVQRLYAWVVENQDLLRTVFA